MTLLEEISRKLKHRLALPLPGLEAQLKMAHRERRLNLLNFKVPDNAKQSAVLIVLYKAENGIKTVIIQRQEYIGVHSGQIAFPGGRKEEDESLAQAALREAEEETGIRAADIEIIGQLTELYIPPSNFLVHPFVGVLPYEPSLMPQQDEVQEIITVDIDDLSDERRVKEKDITWSTGMHVRTPYYDIAGKTIWGATAMILSEFTQIIREL